MLRNALNRVRAAALALRGYRVVRPQAHNQSVLIGAKRKTANNLWETEGRRVKFVGRELVRNSATAARIVDLVAQRTVGRDGIRLRVATGDRELDEQIEQAFWEWSTQADPRGHSLRMLQHQMARELAVAGEAFATWFQSGGRFWLRTFEAEDLDETTGSTTTSTTTSMCGVQYDDLGRAVSYRVARYRPGGLRDYTDYVELPASQVYHVFLADRPGASRGTSPFDAAADLLQKLDNGNEAELDALRLSAYFGLHVRTSQPADEVAQGIGIMEGGDGAPAPLPGADGETAINFHPGGFVNIGDYDAQLLAANRPGGSYLPFVQMLLRQVAARFGLPYAAVSGDYSQNSGVNGRLEELTTQGGSFGWGLLLEERFLQPMFADWCRWAFISGLFDFRGLTPEDVAKAASWIHPGFAYLDPQREAQARQIMISTGLLTWSQAVAETGKDPYEQMLALKKEALQAAEVGVSIPGVGTPTGVPNPGGIGGGTGGPATEPQGNAAIGVDGLPTADAPAAG